MKNWMINKVSVRHPWIIASVIALGLDYVGHLFGGDMYSFFAYPAAWVVAVFFNAEVVAHAGGECLIPLAEKSIYVTTDCSGYGFFCLLVAVIFVKRDFLNGWRIFFRGALGIISFAYIATIVTNAFRIISAYRIDQLISGLLPSSAAKVIHLGVGITVFLTVFLGMYIFLERRAGHAGVSC